MTQVTGAHMPHKHISFANDDTQALETQALTTHHLSAQSGTYNTQTRGHRDNSMNSVQTQQHHEGPFKHFGMLLLAISGMFGALTALLVHLASIEGFGAVEIGWARSVIQTAISGSIILYQRQSPITPPECIPFYIGRGMFGMGGATCLYYGFAVLPLADATALYYTLPIPTAILAWCFLGEAYGPTEVIAAFTGLLGVVCITRPPFLWPFPSSPHHGLMPDEHRLHTHTPAEINLGHIACLFGALLTSMAFVTIRRVGKRTTAWVLTFWHGVSGLGVCGLLMLILDQRMIPESPRQWLLLLGVGICALSVQVLVNKGLQLEAAGPGALMTNIQLVWAYLLQVTFQHKPIIGWCVLGSLLIVSATVGSFLFHAYKDKRDKPSNLAIRRIKSSEMSVLSIEAVLQQDDDEDYVII